MSGPQKKVTVTMPSHKLLLQKPDKLQTHKPSRLYARNLPNMPQCILTAFTKYLTRCCQINN